MPVFLGAHVLIALAFAVHAVRSGQPIYWLVILFMFPGLGSLVYAVTVVLPGLGQSPQARRAGAAARRLIDPERELRTALHQLEISRTPGNLKRAGRPCSPSSARATPWTSIAKRPRAPSARTPPCCRDARRRNSRAAMPRRRCRRWRP